jgi:2-dehydropantoate 2-reductase
MPARNYAILGTGAVGGYYGGLLARAGFEVHFLLHNDYAHVAAHGLLVETSTGSFTLPAVHAYRDSRDMPPCDVVVVALKSTQNHLLPVLLPPVMKDAGVVVMLQNGLGVDEAAAAVVGPQRVLGGLCFLCSNKVGPGHIRHLDFGAVKLGAYAPDPRTPPPVSPQAEAVAADLRAAGVPAQAAADLLLVRWEKLIWNIPFNGLSVALDATTRQIMENPDSLALASALMHEVAAAARASGREIPASYIQARLDDTRRMVPYRTSMKIDYDGHRPMEVEAIFGNPVRAAGKAGCPVPLIEGLYRQLRYLDACNTAP